MATSTRQRDVAKKARNDSNRAESTEREDANNDECICPDCKMAVSGYQQAVECDVCSRWYHNQCQNISAALYKIIGSAENQQISWYCTHCSVKNA